MKTLVVCIWIIGGDLSLFLFGCAIFAYAAVKGVVEAHG